ncbi:MAG: DUF3667 domain-containing protein [Acidobacteriota bacterium]|nr:DUF3667 domain-containing protein [Acidobacteriota bacterium]MDQ5836847.1 DUF3667 domain-containing protein [Acidobacteriota bacterium]
MSEQALTEGEVRTAAPASSTERDESSQPRGVAVALRAVAAAPPRAEADAACPECGTALVGDYCHRCGEKRPEARDLSVRHFVHDAAKELTSLDSKLLRTVWALLLRPGLLTVEWVRGRRSHYLKPLNLCLGVFALSLFAYSAYKPVAMFDVSNLVAQDKTGNLVKVFNHFAEKKHVEPGALLDQISEKWQRFMSLSPVVLVAAFALVLQLVFLFTRRYFVEHLVFSMHFVSFSMLVMVLMWPIYFFIGIHSGGINTLVAAGKWLLDLAYMFFAVRTVYRLGTAKTLLASLPLVAGFFASYVAVFAGTMILAMLVIAL